MATGAIVLFDRTVMIGIVCQEGFHIRDFPVVTIVFTVMTTQAEICRLLDQLFGVICDVRVMTAKTFLLSIEPLMGHGHFLDFTFLVCMAGIAKIAVSFCFQVELKV